jgi:myo-inositol-1(or 4)-monophosphatase
MSNPRELPNAAALRRWAGSIARTLTVLSARIRNRPVLERHIYALDRHGFDEIYVSTHYLSSFRALALAGALGTAARCGTLLEWLRVWTHAFGRVLARVRSTAREIRLGRYRPLPSLASGADCRYEGRMSSGLEDSPIRDAAIELAREAGRALLASGKSGKPTRTKHHPSDVVTESDIFSENIIVSGLRQLFPEHSIIAEESGLHLQSSEYTWVVDPLDGTSNFAAGVPWFGVMLALLQGGEPILGVMHLPVTGELYVAEKGRGAHRNGTRIFVAAERNLRKVLWAYGMDGASDPERRRADAALLGELASAVRNIRTTNCLLDAAYTADGRFGGMLNGKTKVWDIAAPSLIIREAGGAYTDLRGMPLVFELSEASYDRDYAVVAGAPPLHHEVVRLIAAVSADREVLESTV